MVSHLNLPLASLDLQLVFPKLDPAISASAFRSRPCAAFWQGFLGGSHRYMPMGFVVVFSTSDSQHMWPNIWVGHSKRDSNDIAQHSQLKFVQQKYIMSVLFLSLPYLY